MSNELPKEDRTLMSFFNAFHAIGSINDLREHDHLGDAIESVVEEALLRLQVMRLRNCDVGTPQEQYRRLKAFCEKRQGCDDCPYKPVTSCTADCVLQWSQAEYKKEGSAK